jgi:uncharacterized protein YecT (DUF1311 family)
LLRAIFLSCLFVIGTAASVAAQGNQMPDGIDCNNPNSNAAVQWCKAVESESFDKAIVAYLKTTPKQILADTFANTSPTRAEVNEVLKRLMREHEAWVRFVALACDNEIEGRGAIGSGADSFIAECKHDMATARLADLRRRYAP